MQRIAQMIDSLIVGGAQTLQVRLAEAARARDVKLTVISLSHKSHAPLLDQLDTLGVCTITFHAGHWLDPRRIWRMTRFLRDGRFDVLQTHLAYSNVIGAMAGRLAGASVLATLHSTDSHPRPRHAVRRQLETWALRYGAQRVVAVGYSVAEAHRQRLRGKPIDVIFNAVPTMLGLSPAERAALRAELTGDPSRPLLIAVGRLTAAKGYGDLIEAFAMVHQVHPSAYLIIAGDGGLRAELAKQVAALRLTESVMLLGARDDVPRLLAASDLYVSASHWEGLPVSVLEAMAAGLPVVVTGVGDVPRVVVDGTGVVLLPRQPAALAAAMRSLLEDPIRRQALGAAAQAHVARHFGIDAWFDQILALYREVLEGRPQTAA